MDGRSQTIGGGVAQADALFFGLEFSDRAHGAENLFLHYFHVFADAGEDGGLDEVTLFAVALATDFDFRSLLLPGVNVATA